MLEHTPHPIEYRQDLERRVTAKVDAAMRRDEEAREWLVPQLRGLERLARNEGGRHQTIQIIASGRWLLADEASLDLTVDTFAHSPAAAP